MRDFTRYLRRKIPSSGSQRSVSTQGSMDGVVFDRLIQEVREYIDDIGATNAVEDDTTSSSDLVRFCPPPSDQNYKLALPQAQTSTSDWSTASSSDTSCHVIEQPLECTTSTNCGDCFCDWMSPAGFGWETGSAEFPSISPYIVSDLKRQHQLWCPSLLFPGRFSEPG
jgi:hypothetical protein